MTHKGNTIRLAVLMVAGTVGWAHAIEPVDQSYVRSLAAPGKTVLVMEYSDATGAVVERKGYASADGFEAISGTQFRVNANTVVKLYGLEPCSGDMVNQSEGFTGKCADWALSGLNTELENPKVIYCRAFVSEQNAAEQDASCYLYVYFPGAMDSVYNLEEQLVSTGFLRLERDRAGNLLRPDLEESAAIGKEGYGMWADPRVQAQ